MFRRRLLIIVVLVAAWLLLGWTQYREYRAQCQLAQENLIGQAASLRSALVGGIRSHRRMGPFLEEQLANLLEQLVQAKDVLAVAICTDDGTKILTAGNAELLTASPTPGEHWDAGGLRYVAAFETPAETAGPGGGPWGPGGGRGRGRGRWQDESPGLLKASTSYRMVLVLERTTTDAFCQRAARAQGLLFLAETVALAALTLAWWSSVRLAEARGRAAVLQAEARNLRALGQAAAGLAHETRNPLGLVRGWAQRLAASNLPSAEQREHAERVVEECDRVTSRINQFLAFARPAAPQSEPVDIEQLLSELAVLMEPDLEANQLRLDWSSIAGGQTVSADRQLLRQALFNLIANAVHFAPPRSCIEILLRRGQNGQPRLEVADRGPGVAPADEAALFTPYFTTRPGGTGLGLAIVRQIAAAHGWETGYAPRPGGGSLFWLGPTHG
jgi:signal transduction histidine kinase